MWRSPICPTARKRKRKASRTRMLKRRMIRLLEKLLIQRDEIHREHGTSLRYTQDYQKRLSIIRKVLVQEKEMFVGKKVRDRIVSIDRHYVRPIVRGKTNKVRRVRCEGQQHTDRRHIVHRTPLVQGFQRRYTPEGLHPHAAEAHECEDKMRGCRFHICQ